MAEGTELITATEPLVKTLGMECMRAVQTPYLCILVELIKTDSTANGLMRSF